MRGRVTRQARSTGQTADNGWSHEKVQGTSMSAPTDRERWSGEDCAVSQQLNRPASKTSQGPGRLETM